ncbi:hypothetical protein L3Q82_009175 [Scortum barcoo]|uniref:Uncharacterized protein n=1 Tax=Scortum barcoo TaxID=214431 RepID=A0ACB8XBN0_9TELE|nr:hypothetical protein L3Q82_009175 [Scortum barcoo]
MATFTLSAESGRKPGQHHQNNVLQPTNHQPRRRQNPSGGWWQRWNLSGGWQQRQNPLRGATGEGGNPQEGGGTTEQLDQRLVTGVQSRFVTTISERRKKDRSDTWKVINLVTEERRSPSDACKVVASKCDFQEIQDDAVRTGRIWISVKSFHPPHSPHCPLPPGPGQRDTYVRMLFIDYSSAFNTIVPSKLVTKLRDLGLKHHILHPDSEHQARPRAVCSALCLYSLFTHDCMATHSSNTINKFTDVKTVISPITGNDEMVYREEVRALTSWCQDNNLPSQRQQNKGADSGLQEEAERGTRPPLHQRDYGGESQQLQVPRGSHQ